MNMNELGLPNDMQEAAYMLVVENEESAKMYLELQMYIHSVSNTELVLSKLQVLNNITKDTLKKLKSSGSMPSVFVTSATETAKELEKTELALSYTGHLKKEE